MLALTIVATAASVWIVVTYALMVRGGSARAFHAANAYGAIPVVASEIAVGAWAALVLTTAFGIVGWAGLLKRSDA